ncbi:MAG: hypothetical protein J6N70_02580 [Oribacterium sp.]|nr:hypothetical protein [Oribacterium sp.]
MAKREVSPAQKKAYKKYIEGTDEIRVRVPKGTKELVLEHLDKTGETMQDFILRSAVETIERDESTQIRRLTAYRETIEEMIRKRKTE